MHNETGRIINMDNLNSSPEVFNALKNKGLYACGTVRLNHKYLPRFIKYLKKDMVKLERGSYLLEEWEASPFSTSVFIVIM